MAFDPEDLKIRQQLRQQQKAERAARKRKLLIRVAIAVAVLIACGVVIFMVVRNASDKDTSAATVPSESTVDSSGISEGTDGTDTAPTDPETTVIHLAAVGDLNVTSDVATAGGGSYDYTEVFLDVAPVLAHADITAVNFEGNLCGAPYGTLTASAPQGLMDSLSSVGVDLVQLANSYSINHGISGLSDTINGVRAAGMEPLGVSADQAAFRQTKGYTIREVQGVRIAFVAFTKGMNGTALPPGSEHCVNLLYTDYESTYQNVDRAGIKSILDDAKREDPDLIVAMVHWGSEYFDNVSNSQTNIAAYLHENGVDAIIGTHSHYLHRMEYDAKHGTFVAYSLGDFLGDADNAGSEYSVILDLEITKDNRSGKTKITGFSYTPIFTVNDANGMKVLRIREAMVAYEKDYLYKVSEETYGDMEYALTRIAERINPTEETEEE